MTNQSPGHRPLDCPWAAGRLILLWLAAVALYGCTDPGPRAVERARQNGRAIFLENCAPCHGEAADGRGPQSEALDPKPRNYTDPDWRARATEESVYRAISEGVDGSAMPAWEMLPEAQRRDLTTYVLSVAELGPHLEGEEPGSTTE